MNPELRIVMEDGIFLGIFGSDDYDAPVDRNMWSTAAVFLPIQRLPLNGTGFAVLFMSKSETLIHGDFHTSNIFADKTHLKVIDMEYTFGAPFLSYDLGFLR